MCIAAIATKGGFPEIDLRKFFRANRDGAGFSYAENGIINNIRHITDEDEYVALGLSLVNKTNLVTHARIATSGSVCTDNAHPFDLKNGEASLVHNGVLYYETEDDKSDTREVVELIGDLLADEQAMTQQVVTDLGRIIGTGNKFIILYKSGAYKIVNELQGVWNNYTDKTVWYSNSNWRATVVAPKAQKNETPFATQTSPHFSEIDEESLYGYDYPYKPYH